MAPETPEQEEVEGLTEEQKRMILEGYNESLRDDGVDALTVLEETRTAHGF